MKMTNKEYNREKRKFCKLIIDQYKTLGRSIGPTKFSEEFRRLRDFGEALYLGIGNKPAEQVSRRDIEKALQKIGGEYDLYRQQLEYVAELAVGALEKRPAQHFSGVKIHCSKCGELYQLVNAESYQCSGCGYKGKADQHGFPVSVPASDRVRELRHIFHKRIGELYDAGYTQEDSYMLVAFKTGIPLPLVHAGLITSEEILLDMIFECNDILITTSSDLAA